MQFPVGHFFCDFGSARQCIFIKSGSGIWKSTRGLCAKGEVRNIQYLNSIQTRATWQIVTINFITFLHKPLNIIITGKNDTRR